MNTFLWMVFQSVNIIIFVFPAQNESTHRETVINIHSILTKIILA